jgi:predicted RNA-binding Zn-ribbon protein involved in translation (DUF1610 family)
MKKCILCGHAVAHGDRHSKFACPPKAGKHGVHAARKRARLRNTDPLGIQRGMPIAGTGVPKGAQKG